MDWKVKLEDEIKKMRVFSTAEIVSWGVRHINKSERSIKSHLSDMFNEGEVLPIHKGLYTSYDPTNPVKLEEAMPYVSKQAIVSLDSVFGTGGAPSIRGTVNGQQGAVYAIVPINDPNNPPKVGQINTQQGNIRIYSISGKQFPDNSQLDDSFSWRHHAVEAAAAYAILLDANSRSSYTLDNEHEVIKFPKMNVSRFVEYSENLGIPTETITKHLVRFQSEQQGQVIQKLVQAENELSPSQPKSAKTPKNSQ